jgi:hypothetical protein
VGLAERPWRYINADDGTEIPISDWQHPTNSTTYLKGQISVIKIKSRDYLREITLSFLPN